MNSIQQLLSLHEGRKSEPYLDSLGFWTIGVGHLIDARKGGSLVGVRSIPMTEDNITSLLNTDIAEHSAELYVAQPWVKTLDPVRLAVLQDMTFNLGIEPFDHDGFKDWPMFISQVQSKQYEAAKANMLSTLWANQVRTRAVRLAQMLVTGRWPE